MDTGTAKRLDALAASITPELVCDYCRKPQEECLAYLTGNSITLVDPSLPQCAGCGNRYPLSDVGICEDCAAREDS